ncbi:STM4015 family protein [Chamaesiphon sp. VAR_48_metabat_135_sub]|uniref:STM4015 family protein n=1 Tax=Chamaesiphon sp. VAR_48_metabat_135_sub TaxID=2964699 RepID=UPI00286B2DE6|nr:STM4015 family protein [Chamaesiphon sp. VAR_48_metabat_135_sub]
MGIYQRDELFAGKPVVEYTTEIGITDPKEFSYRLSIEYDSEHSIVDLLSQFLADPHISEITSLIIGQWDAEEGSSEPVVNLLANVSQKLPNLTALFLGDINDDEYEISWIQQSDLSPLWNAYPQLEYLRVRGNDGLSFGELKLDRLKTLIVETGGLSVARVREICQGYLPQLEHLELWLGTDDYGGDTRVEDLAPILSGELFPYLQYLGLRNSEIADSIATAVANSTILVRIKVLDLSLGNLGDIGATALLASPFIHQLEKLDLHHHYLSEALVEKLAGLSIVIDVSDPQSADKYDNEAHRYIAVSE